MHMPLRVMTPASVKKPVDAPASGAKKQADAA
jgi:hypothetical protein